MRLAAKLKILALTLAISFHPAWGQTKRAWSPEDSFAMKRLGDLQLSPRGGQLLFVLGETSLSENRSYSAIWSLPAGGKEPLALTDARKGGASNPRWSPDGQRIAYFGGGALWVMNADGSGAKKLTTVETSNAYLGGQGNSLDWSPDGTRLAYAAAGPSYYPNDVEPPHLPTGNEVMIIDRLLHKAPYYYSDLRRTHVYVIPAAGGSPRQLSAGDFDYHSISWSPDGDWIACISNQTGHDDFNANNDIFLLSTQGKPMVRITGTNGPEYEPVWSRDGSRIAYLGRLRAGRSKESDAELKKVYTVPSKGGRAVELTAPIDRWASDLSWSADGKQVFFMVQNEGRQELYAAPAEGGPLTRLLADAGQVGSFAAGKNGGEVYYVYSDFTQPAEMYHLDTSSSAKTRRTHFNDSFQQGVEVLKPEAFSYPSFDGLQIHGWLIRPFGFEEGKKYPMILDVHGGPHGQYGSNLARTVRLQEFAAQGYAVLFTNPRGSTGRGQKFSDLVVGDIGGGDYKDLMAGVDYALKKYDFLDANRMGVSGISYGGYMSQWITTQTGRFKASVPISGISNLISAWSEGANSDWFETDMGFMPMEDYDRAWAVSPLKFIKNCKTPTLFINGRWDFITTLQQADEMFTALKKLGVDAVIAVYPNEGHGVARQPKHTLDYHQRTIAWFDKYVKGETQN